jgi:hypothetical protein
MKDFEKYQQRSKQIAAQALHSGKTLGAVIPWLMITVGVLVTAIQTHALSLRGLRGSELYATWLELAAWLPVVLLEGTATGLILGRLYFFKGTRQRQVGYVASFAVWAVLAFNTLAVFVAGSGELPAPLLFYTRYVLPLSIVAVPYLWKWLLDLHPDSQERIATLEVEAEYAAQWRAIQRQQNEQLVAAYQEAADSPEVKEAVKSLMQKAALQRATEIVGHIDESVPQLRAEFQQKLAKPAPAQTVAWRGGQRVESSLADWPKDPRGN